MENEKSKNLIGTLVKVLAIIGLMTAFVVTVGYLFKKIKGALSQIKDTSFDPLEEEDLTSGPVEEGKEKAEGCDVCCD